jgi:hypothetical protein
MHTIERVGIPLTVSILPLVCACPKPEPGLTRSYVVVFYLILLSLDER